MSEIFQSRRFFQYALTSSHYPNLIAVEVLIKESEKLDDEKPLTISWKESTQASAVEKQVESGLSTDIEEMSDSDDGVVEKFCVNRFWQFCYLSRRNMMNLMRDPRYANSYFHI